MHTISESLYSMITELEKAYFVMRYFAAWEGRRMIGYVIGIVFLLTHIPVVVLSGLAIKEVYGTPMVLFYILPSLTSHIQIMQHTWSSLIVALFCSIRR